jgi:GMP synthase-like glutamine amidotransferase
MGVHDDDDHPWLSAERDLMAATAVSGKPVLGVSLGAQQLAMSLGAEVTTGDEPEIGLGRVELTGPGRLDPVTGPEYGGLSATTIPCLHWHHDTFSLPDGAVHLAASHLFPHQAFRWGDRAYGLQFHVEIDRGSAEFWEPFLPAAVVLNRARLAEVETVGRRLLRRFVQRATSPRPSNHPTTDAGPPVGSPGARR